MNSEKDLAVSVVLPNIAIATCQNQEVISVQLLLGVCQSSVWSEVSTDAHVQFSPYVAAVNVVANDAIK